MPKEEVLRAHAFNLTAYLLSETTSKLYEIFNLDCINIRDCAKGGFGQILNHFNE